MSSATQTLLTGAFFCYWNRLAEPNWSGTWLLPTEEMGAALEDLGRFSGQFAVLGRSGEWGDSRVFDADQLNAGLAKFGEEWPLESYIAPVPEDFPLLTAIAEARAFQALDVYLYRPTWNVEDLAEIADAQWLGAAGDWTPEFVHACLDLEIPFVTFDRRTSESGQSLLLPLVASCVSYVFDLLPTEIQQVLQDHGASELAFGSDDLTWKGMRVPLGGVEEALDLHRASVVDGWERLKTLPGIEPA